MCFSQSNTLKIHFKTHQGKSKSSEQISSKRRNISKVIIEDDDFEFNFADIFAMS